LASYPERDRAAKYDHFMFRERGLNFIQHGEDRNRYYCWSVSPFYDPAVFRYALSCPPAQKGERALFAAILRELAPELLEFDYANLGAPIGSLEFRLKQHVLDFLMGHKPIKDIVARVVKRESEATARIGSRIASALAEGDVEPLASDRIQDVVDNAGSHRPYGLNTLLTLTLLAAELEGESAPRAQAPSIS
jgi:asparagine synthase (glutamine-hydrolysing)